MTTLTVGTDPTNPKRPDIELGTSYVTVSRNQATGEWRWLMDRVIGSECVQAGHLRNPIGQALGMGGGQVIEVDGPTPDQKAVRADLEAKLAVLIGEGKAARQLIATGVTATHTVRDTPTATKADLATLIYLQNQVKSMATVTDGVLGLLDGLIDRVVALARITVDAYDDPAGIDMEAVEAGQQAQGKK